MDNESQPNYMAGYMYKRSGLLGWKKRFYVLKEEPTAIEDLKSYFDRTVDRPDQESDSAEAYELVNKDLFENIAHAFVSGRGLLFEYEDENSVQPLSILSLATVLKLDTPKFQSKKHSFVIKSSISRFVLASDTEAEKDEWIRALVFFRSALETDPDLTETDEYRGIYNGLVSRSIFTAASIEEQVEKIIEETKEEDEAAPVENESVDAEPKAESQSANEPKVETQSENEPKIETETYDAIVESAVETTEAAEGEATADHEEDKEELAPIATKSSRNLLTSIFSCSLGAVAVEEDDYSRYLSDKSFLKKGWLKKKSNFWGKWNERFIVLYKDSIVYFRPSESVPAGKIDVDSGVQIEEVDDSFTFKVICGNHALILAANSQTLMDEWKAEITKLQQ